MKNNQSGRSMVEMLGVLAIIGVLSAGGLAGYSKAMFKHKLNSSMDQLTMLVTNIRTMYGTQENYKDLSVKQAYGLGIIAASASTGTSGSAMVNPFKGAVELAPWNAAAGAAPTEGTDSTNSGFKVTYKGLPKEACISLATADWGTGAGSGYLGVQVGSDATKATCKQIGVGQTIGSTTYSEGVPMRVSDAISQCSGATNDITLYFY